MKFNACSQEARRRYTETPEWVTTNDVVHKMDGFSRALRDHGLELTRKDAYELVCLLKAALSEIESPKNQCWQCCVQPELYMSVLDLYGFPYCVK